MPFSKARSSTSQSAGIDSNSLMRQPPQTSSSIVRMRRTSPSSVTRFDSLASASSAAALGSFLSRRASASSPMRTLLSSARGFGLRKSIRTLATLYRLTQSASSTNFFPMA